MLSKEIREFGVKPFWIANLGGVLAADGQFIEERDEPVGEGMAVGEDSRTELRELEQDWSKLRTQYFHGGKKFFQLRVAVHEDFVVGNGTGSLDGENKIIWSLGGPVFHGTWRRAAIESGVHLHRVKILRVVREIILGFYFRGIESPWPSRRSKRRRAQIYFRLRI